MALNTMSAFHKPKATVLKHKERCLPWEKEARWYDEDEIPKIAAHSQAVFSLSAKAWTYPGIRLLRAFEKIVMESFMR